MLGIVLSWCDEIFQDTDAGKRFSQDCHEAAALRQDTIKNGVLPAGAHDVHAFKRGLPLIEALEITSKTMTNIYYKEAVLLAKEVVTMATTLSEPLYRGRLFPALVCHMLKIGEESGNIEAMWTSWPIITTRG